MAEPSFDLPGAHRWFAVELNNRTWDALESGLVTPETAEPYIHSAHASCYHWMQAGTAANHGRGECLVANVYAAAGRGEAALGHARRYLKLVQADDAQMADWDLAFAYDALARAYASIGERDAAREAREKARAAGGAIADEDDRIQFTRWFEGGDWHGLSGK